VAPAVLSALARRPQPLLVTGVPRSGTTWLARQLAGAPGCALTGREPMNPRGRQYALAGTLDSWARLTRATPRQRTALRLAYAGLTRHVYGRYGHRQWAAALPFTRIVVKDPWAVLSVAAVVRETRALPVLVYRHPAAVLNSYRRMGWLPDLAEVSAAVPAAEQAGPAPASPEQVEAMGWFWATLNGVALADLTATGSGVVVSHEELAAGGVPAMRLLFDACGLAWSPDVERALAPSDAAAAATPSGAPIMPSSGPDEPPSAGDERVLHRLDRASGQVASAWRSGVDDADLATLDEVAGATLARLEAARLHLR